jgi:hypothetical protein
VGAGEIPETGSEKCTSIKKTMKSQSEKRTKKEEPKKKRKKKVPNTVVKNYAPVSVSSRRHLFAVPISVLWAGLQRSK